MRTSDIYVYDNEERSERHGRWDKCVETQGV